ncbi:MAG: CRISPR-associated endonuclease Cas1 [Deltaproteobacteria bacterium]|nr:CRISPR-associated endonuclease Cas1 [Deltaproteobacteria bacterium]
MDRTLDAALESSLESPQSPQSLESLDRSESLERLESLEPSAESLEPSAKSSTATERSSPRSDDDPGWGADALIPVRMVNEFVYCPRLFWLMHRCGIEAENEHVIRGLSVHRRVDRAGGSIAPPTSSEVGDASPWQARGLMLASSDIGVTGKLDLVDDAGGEVMPVDTKKGHPPEEGGLWPPDEVQLALQGILLREAGYVCTRVAAYYVETRQRIVVALTDELVAKARAAVEAARDVALASESPMPLLDSPKCRGCAHNAICQPDEIHLLRRSDEASISDEEDEDAASGGRAIARESVDAEMDGPGMDGPKWGGPERGGPRRVGIRRVIPAASDALPVYVGDPGSTIGVEKESLVVRPRDRSVKPSRVGLGTVSSLNVFGVAQVTTPAIRACLERGVPINWFSSSGWYYGRASGHENNNVLVRIGQYRAFEGERALEIARVLIGDKIANSRTLLRRNGSRDGSSTSTLDRLRELTQKARAMSSAQSLLAVEGEAARHYWQHFSEMTSREGEAFRMHGRNRRPPRDRVNAMLGYVYGLLVRDTTHAVATAGLDPFLGMYHTPHHGRPSLALDLMEPFRPLIADSVVLGVIRRGEVDAKGFVETGPSVVMRTNTRRSVVAAYERRMREEIKHPVLGYTISYRQVLGVQARLLARRMVDEIPAFPSFVTR